MKLNWINRQDSLARSIALGTFDGVHRGHQELLKKTIARKPSGGTSCVLTFDIPPEQFFRGQLCLISSFERRVELFSSFGIDEITWLTFGSELTSMSAQYFVEEILVNKMNAKEITCGYNYRFGKKRLGDAAYLEKQGKHYGFSVTIVPPVQDQGGQTISSTKIRQHISEGDLNSAAHYLGYYPIYQGNIVESNSLCSILAVDSSLVLPRQGLYLTWCIFAQDQGRAALASITPDRKINLVFLEQTFSACPASLDIQFLHKLRSDKSPQIREIDLAKSRELLHGFHLQHGKVVLR